MSPVSPERWKQVEALFDGALDQPTAERASWLERACAQDPELLAEVRELLRSHEEAGSSFEEPAAIAAAEVVLEGLSDPMRGQQLGPYRLTEEIGHGGMGVVYRAERRDGEFDQEVVIKLLRAGVDTEEARRRFRQERQILANLDHDNIARLLDGGVAPDGRPYIVMDLIRGTRIDLYCDSHRATIDDRLRLFLQVIGAVQFAHRSMIVHRDLKPSNVLVTEDGRVKLLDFGIAKMLDRDAEAGVTRTEFRMMTPEYASPEQIRMEPITTASDVYQLGVLLYELLTGHPPYEFRGRSPLDIGRTICEEEPEAPSHVVTQRRTNGGHSTGTESQSISEARNMTAAKMRRALGGDLDRILLMALRKEPERRYPSAEQMGQDIRRHLQGLPVAARGDTFGYRFGKFVGRHWAAVITAAVISMVLFAGAIFYTVRVSTERDRAQREAHQRAEISDFVVDIFKVSDFRSPGADVTGRELLDWAKAKIEDEPNQPDVRARMLGVVGRVSMNLGLMEEAREPIEESYRLNQELYGERSIELAESASLLGAFHVNERNFDRALPYHEEALAIRRELLHSDHPDLAQALFTLASTRRDAGDSAGGEDAIREALAIQERTLPANHPNRIASQGVLAYVLRAQNENDEAEVIYRDVIEQLRTAESPRGETLSTTLNNLAYLLTVKEEYPEAETLYREAVTLRAASHGEAHPSTLMFRRNFAGCLMRNGKFEEAEQNMAELLRITKDIEPEGHWRIGSAHRAMGRLYVQMQQPAKAEPEFRESVRIWSAGLGPEHGWTASGRAELALSLELQGRTEESAQHFADSVPILSRPESLSNQDTRFNVQYLVDQYERIGRSDRARVYEEMLESYRNGNGN